MRLRLTGAERRHGLTLLEVLVSLAIFLMALVALVRLVSLGNERALDTMQQTEGLRRCQSKLAEVIIGAVPLNSQSGVAFDDDPSGLWTWSLDCQQGAVTNLWNVQVRCTRQRSANDTLEVSLSQMVLDPSVRGSTIPSSNTGSGSSSGTTGGS
jgi:general secretion pathway protein I